MESWKARKRISGLKYNGKLIVCEFYSRKLFLESSFGKQVPKEVKQMDAEYEGLENCAIDFEG